LAFFGFFGFFGPCTVGVAPAVVGWETDAKSAQLLFPSRSVTQLLLQQSLFFEQLEVAGFPQQPTSQMPLLQALAVVQAPPTPTEPAATQKPKLQASLEQSEFDVQVCPFPHFPQSLLHSTPEFEFPQLSVPSQ
jgi:hypothetical protein